MHDLCPGSRASDETDEVGLCAIVEARVVVVAVKRGRLERSLLLLGLQRGIVDGKLCRVVYRRLSRQGTDILYLSSAYKKSNKE